MASSYDVLIVGSGHGGAQAAMALRMAKFAGSIAIVSDEPDLPYERPPLSKDFLSGEKTFERLLIRPETFWAERQVTMLGGQRVVAIDPPARRVSLADGTTLGYRLTHLGHRRHSSQAHLCRASLQRRAHHAHEG